LIRSVDAFGSTENGPPDQDLLSDEYGSAYAQANRDRKRVGNGSVPETETGNGSVPSFVVLVGFSNPSCFCNVAGQPWFKALFSIAKKRKRLGS